MSTSRERNAGAGYNSGPERIAEGRTRKIQGGQSFRECVSTRVGTVAGIGGRRVTES